MGFPVHRQLPQELCSSIGLTFPPRAGVLVPKTETFSLELLPISLVFAYGMEVKMNNSIIAIFSLDCKLIPISLVPNRNSTTTAVPSQAQKIRSGAARGRY